MLYFRKLASRDGACPVRATPSHSVLATTHYSISSTSEERRIGHQIHPERPLVTLATPSACHPEHPLVMLSAAKHLTRRTEMLRCTQHDSSPPDCRA